MAASSSPVMDALLHTLILEQKEMLALLRRFVECESPSSEKALVDRFGEIVAGQIRDLGGRASLIPGNPVGNHLHASFGLARGKTTRQILLLGHLDTVWEAGTLVRMPFRARNGRAYGPGVFDMKAGIVLALFALRSLRRLGIPLRKNVCLLLNSDEEIGSPSSRSITEREARKS